MTNRLAFPAKVKDTGCSVMKITLPEQTMSWISKSNPDIDFLDEARITTLSSNTIVLKDPHLSKGTNGRRYFAIPKKVAEQYNVQFNDEIQVEVSWS